MRRFECPFDFNDRVILDDDESICGRVTGIWFRALGTQVEVSWIHAGDSKSAWVDLFRVSPAPNRGR